MTTDHDTPLSPDFNHSLTFNAAALGYLLKGHFRLSQGHRPTGNIRIPEDFSAICVASMADPRCDDMVIDYLNDLNLRHVRLDYGYSAPTDHSSRFLEKLLDRGFNVLLRLVQPMDEAALMHTQEAQQRWQAFIETTLQRFGARLEAVEIGNTVNRRNWSGYNDLSQFMAAWRIAHRLLQEREIALAAPTSVILNCLITAGSSPSWRAPIPCLTFTPTICS